MVPNPKSNDASKTTASTPKSSSSDGVSSGVINSTQFVEFILELVQSEDLREEFEKYLLDPKSYDISRARGALGEVIADMFKIPLNNTLRPFATNFFFPFTGKMTHLTKNSRLPPKNCSTLLLTRLMLPR